jgi:hypothetical protein
MVEVFKTNVEDPEHAAMLLRHIHIIFREYTANFDLEDCDKILRVKSNNGDVEAFLIIDLLSSFGFRAEILPDEEGPIGNSEKNLKNILFPA